MAFDSRFKNAGDFREELVHCILFSGESAYINRQGKIVHKEAAVSLEQLQKAFSWLNE